MLNTPTVKLLLGESDAIAGRYMRKTLQHDNIINIICIGIISVCLVHLFTVSLFRCVDR